MKEVYLLDHGYMGTVEVSKSEWLETKDRILGTYGSGKWGTDYMFDDFGNTLEWLEDSYEDEACGEITITGYVNNRNDKVNFVKAIEILKKLTSKKYKWEDMFPDNEKNSFNKDEIINIIINRALYEANKK